ncbi:MULTISPECIES: PTS fructose transporter subunit IIABC [unclassified Bacillus (in: firmicutes)]|uniref:PTS fructose transporter subunit IIABC n=1 Tax=unclassified Bacillus (in: firmicutes) TaxID=185979 RepID=UPI00032DFF79|nr:PTS sugar transporter subunit IIA [Bacillus wiedmannii]EOP12825.1 PTS system, Fru family, IIC component [Bacillus cereus BAG2O-3]EOQ09385.1 PTS system, Fru family, IIC component [Bacillus cereus B5-2]MDA1601007.1 fructose-specific PTS transporter subunit EIIC [Bacillus cereus]PFW82656.1 PTS fructose transporter subunit IIC [Bacillus sp. AFS075960]RFB49743.1 PTS fructose transporter subunit IIC [Bacillus sp. dmp10]RFB76741.1 PTS fructose transporter subunit IIC [Bacillus sp. AW]
MKITELLKKDTVIMNLTASNKEAVIDELVEKLASANRLNSKAEFKEAIFKRESQSTTGIGEGIAIPHAKTKAVKQPAICFGRSVSGINYESLDGQPAHLFFMIAASEGANNTHLETLSRLSTLLMDEGFRRQLLEAKDGEELLRLFDEKENEKEEEEVEVAKPEGNEPYVLAVTACPTGIAHTYMAADSLKAKAAELGIAIKVETNGSTGIKNGLTKEDIERATTIIVAADKQVEMNRFAGKHVIQVPVADGIRKTEVLLNRAVKQDAPIFKGIKEDGKAESTEKEKGLGIYKHLMSGVSNMLPFVVGGGILIALAFMFGGIKAEGPIAEILMTIGGGEKGAFLFLVPILAGFIASSIADRPGFMPGVVGGFLAAQANAGFLGGLIAGFLAGYIVLGLKRLFSGLPVQLEGIKPVLLYPVFGLLITGVVMQKVVNPPVVALNEMLTGWLNGLSGTNAILLGLILGGMMAIDMGGPINKAAFTFGIAAIEAKNFGVHSAVMAGGMVPPLAIAFATTFFKSKFTEAERKSGLTNYIMGASFITEGAIPFAAADPVRVIVSCVVGSSIAGALSMLFQITLPAPHGGLFVIALVNKPVLYIFSIFIGTVVSALMMGIWKKKVK